MDIANTRVQQCVHALGEKFNTSGTYAEVMFDTDTTRYMLSYAYGDEESVMRETLEAIIASFKLQ